MWPRPLRRILQLRYQINFYPFLSTQSFSIRYKSYKAVTPPVIMPSAHKFTSDRIFIDALCLRCTCGPDAFGRVKAQPVLLSIDLGTTVARAAASDRVDLSIDYGALGKELAILEKRSFKSPVELIEEVVGLSLEKDGVGNVSVVVQLEKGALMAKKITWERIAFADYNEKGLWKLGIEGLEIPVIIGVEENTHERTRKQLVRIDLTWEILDHTSKLLCAFDIQNALESIINVQSSSIPSDVSESLSYRKPVHRVPRYLHRRSCSRKSTFPYHSHRSKAECTTFRHSCGRDDKA